MSMRGKEDIVLCVQRTDGYYDLVARSDRWLSKREIRKYTKKFKDDADFSRGVQMESLRFEKSDVDALPRI